jgi:hypothetical protein
VRGLPSRALPPYLTYGAGRRYRAARFQSREARMQARRRGKRFGSSGTNSDRSARAGPESGDRLDSFADRRFHRIACREEPQG